MWKHYLKKVTQLQRVDLTKMNRVEEVTLYSHNVYLTIFLKNMVACILDKYIQCAGHPWHSSFGTSYEWLVALQILQ